MQNFIKRYEKVRLAGGETEGIYDSPDEYYFECLLRDLSNTGFIESWKYQPKSFILSETIKVPYTEIKVFKRKENEEIEKFQVLLNGNSYTPDFLIIWNPKALGFLISLIGKHKMNNPFIAQIHKGKIKSIIDIKGGFVMHNMDRELSIIKKWVYQKYNIYVQTVKCFNKKSPSGKFVGNLFDEVFTPKEYLIRHNKRGTGFLKNQLAKSKTESEFLKEYEEWLKI